MLFSRSRMNTKYEHAVHRRAHWCTKALTLSHREVITRQLSTLMASVGALSILFHISSSIAITRRAQKRRKKVKGKRRCKYSLWTTLFSWPIAKTGTHTSIPSWEISGKRWTEEKGQSANGSASLFRCAFCALWEVEREWERGSTQRKQGLKP